MIFLLIAITSAFPVKLNFMKSLKSKFGRSSLEEPPASPNAPYDEANPQPILKSSSRVERNTQTHVRFSPNTEVRLIPYAPKEEIAIAANDNSFLAQRAAEDDLDEALKEAMKHLAILQEKAERGVSKLKHKESSASNEDEIRAVISDAHKAIYDAKQAINGQAGISQKSIQRNINPVA